MSKPRTESFVISDSRSRIERNHNEHGVWLDGDVVTWYGIVSVYSQEGYSRYDFACGGRHFIRTEYRARTKRGLAIQATKFAREFARGMRRSSSPSSREG